jgi:hypothetical protein
VELNENGELVGIFEIQRRGIDAVTHAGWLWAIFEHMSKMRVALTADDFLSNHAATFIDIRAHRIAGER